MSESRQIVFKTRVESRLKITKDPDELLHVGLGFLHELGMSGFDFQSPCERNTADFRLSTLPENYTEQYADLELGAYDMLAEHAYHSKNIIFGSVIYHHINSASYETKSMYYTKKAQEVDEKCGIHDCLIIPLHSSIENRNGHRKNKDETATLTVFNIGQNQVDFQRHARRHMTELCTLANSLYTLGYKRFLKPSNSHSCSQPDVSMLSKRQLQILQQFACHGIYPDIVASTLYISERTVEKHAENIRKILNLRSTHEAVMLGIRQGLIHP